MTWFRCSPCSFSLCRPRALDPGSALLPVAELQGSEQVMCLGLEEQVYQAAGRWASAQTGFPRGAEDTRAPAPCTCSLCEMHLQGLSADVDS